MQFRCVRSCNVTSVYSHGRGYFLTVVYISMYTSIVIKLNILIVFFVGCRCPALLQLLYSVVAAIWTGRKRYTVGSGRNLIPHSPITVHTPGNPPLTHLRVDWSVGG